MMLYQEKELPNDSQRSSNYNNFTDKLLSLSLHDFICYNPELDDYKPAYNNIL